MYSADDCPPAVVRLARDLRGGEPGGPEPGGGRGRRGALHLGPRQPRGHAQAARARAERRPPLLSLVTQSPDFDHLTHSYCDPRHVCLSSNISLIGRRNKFSTSIKFGEETLRNPSQKFGDSCTSIGVPPSLLASGSTRAADFTEKLSF